MNFTVEAPEGTTHHGDPKLLCKPPNWQDYIAFYALNYLIHAATIPSEPGETKTEVVLAVLNALFIPGFGVLRAVRRLMLRPGLRRRVPLECANAAGALCMVVSDESFLPKKDRASRWTDDTFDRHSSFLVELPATRKVHGICHLPAGYRLCTVPFRTKLEPASGQTWAAADSGNPNSRQRPVFMPSCEYNVVKVLFSLVQAVAGGITIYRTRGDIDRYGYDAFGLSVVPYFLMSVVNIVASLLSPEFPTMYLVHSPDIDEAREKGGSFEGLVRRLVPLPHGTPHHDKVPIVWDERHGPWFKSINRFLVAVLVALPLVIAGGMSGFRSGDNSTAAQRGWITSWIVLGSISSSLWLRLLLPAISEPKGSCGEVFLWCFFSVPLWIPAIGGMVMVGLELREYGVCTRID